MVSQLDKSSEVVQYEEPKEMENEEKLTEPKRIP